jgi:Ni,Fe-hydrogenase maturation factor
MRTVLNNCSRAAASSRRAPEILLLGLGNDILTDDAIGLHVAAAVRERLAGCQFLTVRQTGEMGLSLLDFIFSAT